MTSSFASPDAAGVYAAEVRALFAPAPHAPAARGVRSAVLAEQAAELAPRSANLTGALSAGLVAPDPRARAQAATQLLAKALTDLQIGAYLLTAASEAAPVEATAAAPATMARDFDAIVEFASANLEESLTFLLGEQGGGAQARRGIALPPDLPTARTQLAALATTTLSLIEMRAAKTGQTALSGLLALGLGPVAQAAGIVGLDIAQALGVAERVTKLYALAREFILNAYNALVALCGPALAQSAAQQAVAWLNDVAAGQQFATLLEQIYETKLTGEQVGKLIVESQADLGRFALALQEVEALRDGFGEQLSLVDRLLQGFRLLSGAAVSALPQAIVLMAAAYLVITGYAVLTGADYVDAGRLKFLNRVPGVRQVIESSLVVE